MSFFPWPQEMEGKEEEEEGERKEDQGQAEEQEPDTHLVS